MTSLSRQLRDRITIQEPGTATQNADTGAVSRPWVDVLVDEPAKVDPVSVRDFIASGALQSVIVARIKIRYRDGMHSRMRILHDGVYYDPQGWLPDPETGGQYLTAPCSEWRHTT